MKEAEMKQPASQPETAADTPKSLPAASSRKSAAPSSQKGASFAGSLDLPVSGSKTVDQTDASSVGAPDRNFSSASAFPSSSSASPSSSCEKADKASGRTPARRRRSKSREVLSSKSGSMKNVVVIGGGTGLSAMMNGLKHLKDVNLTAIITVADDGGSTGRIRDVYNIPAMGDIRHVLCAMAEEDNESLFSQLMNYRFAGSEDIGGHQLGNLIFLALADLTGSFMGAIQAISKVLKVRGSILPSTLDNAILYALMKDGTLVRGEKNIPNTDNSIARVFYEDAIHAYPKAIEAISQADLIVYGIGSLYTSILPNVIVRGVREAIAETSCPKVYFCNAMTQPGETDNFSLEDHVRAIEYHTYKNPIELAVINSAPVDPAVLERYARQGSVPVVQRESDHSYKIIERDLTRVDETGRIRHDSDAIAQCLEEILAQMEKDGRYVVFE